MNPHYLNGSELDADQTLALLDLAIKLKKNGEAFAQALSDISIVGLFEKPSLRTRVSFEIGLRRLGAQAVYLDHQQEKIGARESIKDYARNLSVWSQGLFVRVHQHETICELAKYASVPVVNALCDQFHPCQALADIMTVYEHFGRVKGLRIAYIGDGNNVSHSLMLLACKLGAKVSVITPALRQPNAEKMAQASALAQISQGSFSWHSDMAELGKQDVIYTDTWISMGSKLDSNSARQLFNGFHIDQNVMNGCQASMFLHCQPAHRGEEVSDEVLDGNSSFVLPQAENRMHTQNALWLKLLNRV